jgi:hypothetical protein
MVAGVAWWPLFTVTTLAVKTYLYSVYLTFKNLASYI